jgi:hypothetical protein
MLDLRAVVGFFPPLALNPVALLTQERYPVAEHRDSHAIPEGKVG